MDLKELEKKLYKEIPLTKFMEIKLDKIEKNSLISSAAFKKNKNDKNTGFAGSLSTLVTISGWCACYLNTIKLGYEKSMIAIIKSDTAYKAAVTKDFYCETTLPTQEEINLFKKKLESKKSSSLRMKSQIIENGKICVKFEGIYIIKV
ncbi:thioesterase [Malaciobacter molluscorum LMG 25693]|uniref:Thioesterase n=1 Tax=Malaciobacter molluscorum LMG 25693 TaxID=870501 RepID=A0A2G1DLD2_9BACT|nr:YiiD C-terminal domain-containing protein [Malaciobacter molluscorum]AXX92051.1 putative thioesterase (yiiD_Cterm domain) [Malaciobacter molluscorum LMG 25693]PHO19281.1 thioesterase [Malaciobacter molluscorum LMG 25693]